MPHISKAEAEQQGRRWDLAEHHEILMWNENARRERMKDGKGFSSMLEEFATLGVLPSRGRRRESFGGIE